MTFQDNLNRINDLDVTIHNPARLMIVFLLARNKNMDYTKLMQDTQLTSGNITTHLNKLMECGFVKMQKSFKGRKPNTSITLTQEGQSAYQKWGESILWALPDQQLPQFRALRVESEAPESALPELPAQPFTAGAVYHRPEEVASHPDATRRKPPALKVVTPGDRSASPSPPYHAVTVEPIPERRPIPSRLDPGYHPVELWSYSWTKHTPLAQSGSYYNPPESQIIKVIGGYYLLGSFLPALEENTH